jgi:hypothetical protein
VGGLALPSLNEIIGDGPSTPIHDALSAGLDVLSGEQTVEFVPYIRTVLPIDGFVFWVRASLLPQQRLVENGLQSPDSVVVEGSLHYASVGTMLVDENISIQRVDFAAKTPITDFAQVAPNVLYVAEWQTPLGAFKFTFNNRGTYYQQADIHHYTGDAVYPVFTSQLIDNVEQFDRRQVVSNSLPLWLSVCTSIPFVSEIVFTLPLYPAYLVPANLPAPYAAVEIMPGTTRALTARAYMDANSNRWQLVSETARLTFYGLRNDDVLDFVDYVVTRSANLGDFGIMNMPVVRDEYRPQVELSALAMKKTVDFDINYYQTRMRDISRQLIREAFASLYLGAGLFRRDAIEIHIPT